MAQEAVEACWLHIATPMKRMGVKAPVSKAKHLETDAGQRDPPLSAAEAANRPA
jgi:hypothetical protein